MEQLTTTLAINAAGLTAVATVPHREFVVELMDGVALVIGVIGMLVIAWGVLRSLVALARMEVAARSGGAMQTREALRHELGYYLLLGLEFLVAADIVESIIAPSLEHLAVLGTIVAIRTVISFSLNWELTQHRRTQRETGGEKDGVEEP